MANINNTLATHSLYHVNGFFKLMQVFVRVHAFGYAGRGMAEDALYGRFVGTGIIKHRGAGVTALVRRVIAACRIHDVVKTRPETMIGQSSAIINSNERFSRLIHPRRKIGQYLFADGYSSVAASLGLAVAYDVIALLKLDICFKDRQKLARPRSAVYHHDDSLSPA